MRTLLVGLDNPLSDDSTKALLPIPERGSGGRIVELIEAGLKADGMAESYSVRDYLRDFHRVNLYPIRQAATGKGATKLDRLMAQWCLMYAVVAGYQNIVLFGNRVRSAFADIVELGAEDTLDCQIIDADWFERGHKIAFHTVPHPSGRNRFYNEPENCLLVGRRLADLRERRNKERAT